MRDWDRFSGGRLEYRESALEESAMCDCPVEQFLQWYQEAEAAGAKEPNAFSLSTVAPDGMPASRMLLLKLIEDGKFYFFSNYKSTKGKHLEKNGRIALLFFWQEFHRQVRIQGVAEKAAAEISDEYFKLRPEGAKIGAIASPQSEIITSREMLEERILALEKEYASRDIPRPEHWGGYAVTPCTIEFWQGRTHRLHDRILYSREGKSWKKMRLAP